MKIAGQKAWPYSVPDATRTTAHITAKAVQSDTAERKIVTETESQRRSWSDLSCTPQ